MRFQIASPGPEQWEMFRSVRLKALADTPDAFGSTFDKERGLIEDDWRKRLERSGAKTFVALTEGGAPVGLIVGAPYDEDAGLFSMWVDSSERRKGIGSELVDAVILWARNHQFNRLLLDVADQNVSAIRFYESKGFTSTGITGTLPPPREHITERQLVFAL